MKKNIQIFLLLLIPILSNAQTPNSGEIHLEMRYHSYLGDLIDTNITLGVGGGMWSLVEYELNDSLGKVIQKNTYWNSRKYSTIQTQSFENLSFGKYTINLYYWKNAESIILTKKNPTAHHTIYWNENSKIDTSNTFIEQMKNDDTLTFSVNRYPIEPNSHKKITIIRTDNQFELTLKSDKIYSRLLTQEDRYIIKCFEWDSRRNFSKINCNDIEATYIIKWKGQEKRISDNCNLWNACEMLQYLLFAKS